jgi:hypothetical protein
MTTFTSPLKLPFANTPEFEMALGKFFAAWSRAELAIDYATWKYSGTETPEQAHERCADATFSDKCKLLERLLKSEHARELLNEIASYGRNVFAHSFLATDEDSVTFIHRAMDRTVKPKKYQVTAYEIPRSKFIEYVREFVRTVSDFERAANLPDNAIREFASMALPLTEEKAPSDQRLP